MKKNGDKSRNTGMKNGDKKMKHYYKLSLMRDCQIFGKDYEESKKYFKSNGFTLGSTQFTDLRNELKSAKSAKNWFSKEALFVIEEDHMLSVERIRMMEDRLMEEFEQVSSTSFYNNYDITKPNQELTRNTNHDADLLLKIIAQFESLQLTKTKMFSCTPMVQAMMEVHRKEEDEAN